MKTLFFIPNDYQKEIENSIHEAEATYQQALYDLGLHKPNETASNEAKKLYEYLLTHRLDEKTGKNFMVDHLAELGIQDTMGRESILFLNNFMQKIDNTYAETLVDTSEKNDKRREKLVSFAVNLMTRVGNKDIEGQLNMLDACGSKEFIFIEDRKHILIKNSLHELEAAYQQALQDLGLQAPKETASTRTKYFYKRLLIHRINESMLKQSASNCLRELGIDDKNHQLVLELHNLMQEVYKEYHRSVNAQEKNKERRAGLINSTISKLMALIGNTEFTCVENKNPILEHKY